jgi:hypothetical protein
MEITNRIIKNVLNSNYPEIKISAEAIKELIHIFEQQSRLSKDSIQDLHAILQIAEHFRSTHAIKSKKLNVYHIWYAIMSNEKLLETFKSKHPIIPIIPPESFGLYSNVPTKKSIINTFKEANIKIETYICHIIQTICLCANHAYIGDYTKYKAMDKKIKSFAKDIVLWDGVKCKQVELHRLILEHIVKLTKGSDKVTICALNNVILNDVSDVFDFLKKRTT